MILLAALLATPPAFETAVRPVLVEHCLKCHGPDVQKGGLRLDSWAALLAGGDTGPAVVPGKPADSLLVKAVRHDELEMPPGKTLPAAQTAARVRWVADGAVWPAEPAPTAADDPRWVYRPPVRPAVPAAGDGWARNPIDRFVAARLGGLAPTPEADRRTLVRRLTFGPLGLPPTPAEIAAFERDPAPDAYERLVDRLLASRHYGERWARRWLDVVRYADTDGFERDEFRPAMWRYRDWVVRAANADLPYDQFVRLQLAGDELADRPVRSQADADRWAATGFLRLGPRGSARTTRRPPCSGRTLEAGTNCSPTLPTPPRRPSSG